MSQRKISVWIQRGVSLLCVLPIIGCMTVPHPFEKNSGQSVTSLTNPPPARLIVPTPTESLLDDKASNMLAHDIAKAMLDQTVPAVATKAEKGDWLLMTKVRSENGMAIPTFSIVSPDGKTQATRDGMPIALNEWSTGDEKVLSAVAQQIAPVMNDILTGLQARQMANDPNSLKNRAAQVYFAGIKGAPGDGNVVLSRQFVISFPDKFNAIQAKKDKADYIVSCQVTVTKGTMSNQGKPMQHIEVIWEILDNKGKEAGKVVQVNEVPAHSLDQYWGDVASVVGQEAAGGIRHVISNYSGRNNKPLPKDGVTKAPLVMPVLSAKNN